MSIGLFFLVFALLLFLAVPVGACFAGISLLPSLVDPSFPYKVDAAVRSMVQGLNSFPVLAVPLFMFSGAVMAKGGISEKLFNFFAYFFGKMRSGYPCTVIITCLFFGAISGSGPATVAAVGTMTIPILVSLGYDKIFATAIVTISGGLGIIIPPSIAYVIYATSSNASTGDLFLAGILPGVLIALCLMIYTYIYCRINGEDRERLEKNYEEIRAKGLLNLFKECFWALLTPVIILGSIYGGIASPTEAAGISVLYAILVSMFAYRSIKFRELPAVFCEAVSTYAPILLVIAGSTAFSRVVTLLGIPAMICDLILGAVSGKVAVLLIINLTLLISGMILDSIPAIIILTPILLPLAQAVGVDNIHFGIIMTCNLAIGQVTPPMGINLFVASTMTQIPVTTLAKKIMPFIAAFIAALLVITFVPWLSLVFLG